jgi:hypothetical protein
LWFGLDGAVPPLLRVMHAHAELLRALLLGDARADQAQ